MARSDHRSLLTTIDKLYAAAMEPAAWHDFLRPVATLFNADNAYISEIDFTTRRVLEYVGLPQPNRDKMPVSRFATVLDEDPRMALFRIPDKRAVHCRMATSQAQLHASRTYRDYLKPLNIEYTLVANVRGRTSDSTRGIGFTRGREKTEFDWLDRELLAELMPHLERCFAMREALNAKAAPIAHVACHHELLRKTFALSPVQARLALALFDGRSIRDVAKDLSITEGSARQYLYRVFDKTGVRRQADLMRLFARVLRHG